MNLTEAAALAESTYRDVAKIFREQGFDEGADRFAIIACHVERLDRAAEILGHRRFLSREDEVKWRAMLSGATRDFTQALRHQL